MTAPEQRRIGDAAAELGVATHVLRHWEDMGLLQPQRSASGHRVYDRQAIDIARLIQVGQRAGLSLAEMIELAAGDKDTRAGLIQAKRESIARRIADLDLADRFLAHVLTCAHPVMSECPGCSSLLDEKVGMQARSQW